MKRDKLALLYRISRRPLLLRSLFLLTTVLPVAAANRATGQDQGVGALLALLEAWGPCPAVDVCPWDLNKDGFVGDTDFAWLLGVGPLDNGIPEGYMIIEGDILVPVDFFEQESVYVTNLWPGAGIVAGIVPFQFAMTVNATQQATAIFAMTQWENVANVDFRPWQPGDANFIFIQDTTFNSSFVGMQGGSQTVNIVSWTSPFIIAHELGHALGFWHEQQRSDATNWIQINTANIANGCFNPNFHTKGFPYGPYDFDSVMQYGQCGCTVCAGCPNDPACVEGGTTITVLPGGMTDCCYANGTPGCDDPACTNAVCAVDPFCCDTAWDGICAAQANNLCENCIEMTELFGCNTPAPGQYPNGTPYADCQTHIGQRNHLSHFDGLTMSFLYEEPNWRFVDANNAGPEDGTFIFPFVRFTIGAANTPAGGTLWVQPGSYNGAGTYSTAMTIRAPLGGVTLD